MITIKSELHGIEESITRPILIQVVSDVKTLLGLKKDIFTIFNPKDNLNKQKTESGDVIGKNTITADKITIEYEENSEDLGGINLIPSRPDFKPIYKDDDIGSKFTPICHSRKLTIQFRYINKSKSKVFSIANKLKLLPSSDSADRLHDLEYSYLIPNFLSKLLMEINNLKNTRIPDGEKLSLEQYIDNTFDNRLDFANTLDGDITKSELAIREAQLDIEGYFTDDLESLKPEYDDTEGAWVLDFTYELQYEKPVTLLITYPILIYNNVIDKFFRTFNNVKQKRDFREIRTGRAQDMYNVVQREQDVNDPLFLAPKNYYLKIPEFDTYTLPNNSSKYMRLCSILTQVDEIDNTILFNLNEIPKLKLKKVYYDYLLLNRDHISKEYETIILLELYQDDKKDYTNKIYIENDGTLKSTIGLDYKKTYRVTLSILLDPDCLVTKFKEQLKQIVKADLNTQPRVDGTSILQFKKYYQHINYYYMYWDRIHNRDKFGNIINYGNIIVDWFTIIQPDPDRLNKIIQDAKKFTDILDYTLSDKLNSHNFLNYTNGLPNLRTVQIQYALVCLFEHKERKE